MENQRKRSDNVPTFDMIPMLMANLLEDNKILSAKIDALNNADDANIGGTANVG